jgi:TolB-like protein/DNA-binding winged helix-turn-helix (wHTH) protein/Flp pilus assembly protein TadD
MSSLNSNLYQFGEFRLEAQTRLLRKGLAVVPLTPKAFDVLLLLIQNGGRIVTKDELMKAVWPDSFVEESNLTQTIFMVRKALDESSDRRYIVSVQGQGYRFVVPVTEIASHVAEIDAAAADKPTNIREIRLDSPPQRTKNWKSAAIVFAALALFVILASTVRSWRFWPSAADRPDRVMLAVLPFENFTGDPAQEYFSDGLTEEMIGQLGNLDPKHLGVIARTSVMHYKHSPEPITQIGKTLGVQYVIEGSVRRDSQRVRITAQLIQVRDQSHLWSREYDRELGRLLELQGEIAREVASEIEFSLGGRRPIDAASGPAAPAPGAMSGASSYESYDLYLKGRYFWNKRTVDGFQQAADYFQRAIDKNPNNSRAYVGLADTFSLMSTWYEGPQNELMPKAQAAALRALQLDESLAEAHTSLALIKENYDYDWSGAEKEFRRAIQLNPQYATAHQWYAEFLSWQGRFNEAFAESELARQLDPLSLIIATDHSWILYYSRQYDNALKQCRSVLELDPDYDRARNSMILPFAQLGKYDEAMEVINHWTARSDDLWPWAYRALISGRSGHAEEARQALAKLDQLSAGSAERTITLLIAYSGTGQKEQVIELLQKAYSEHSNAVLQVKVDPMYDPIRSDPRFQDLVQRVGLSP